MTSLIEETPIPSARHRFRLGRPPLSPSPECSSLEEPEILNYPKRVLEGTTSKSDSYGDETTKRQTPEGILDVSGGDGFSQSSESTFLQPVPFSPQDPPKSGESGNSSKRISPSTLSGGKHYQYSNNYDCVFKQLTKAASSDITPIEKLDEVGTIHNKQFSDNSNGFISLSLHTFASAIVNEPISEPYLNDDEEDPLKWDHTGDLASNQLSIVEEFSQRFQSNSDKSNSKEWTNEEPMTVPLTWPTTNRESSSTGLGRQASGHRYFISSPQFDLPGADYYYSIPRSMKLLANPEELFPLRSESPLIPLVDGIIDELESDEEAVNSTSSRESSNVDANPSTCVPLITRLDATDRLSLRSSVDAVPPPLGDLQEVSQSSLSEEVDQVCLSTSQTMLKLRKQTDRVLRATKLAEHQLRSRLDIISASMHASTTKEEIEVEKDESGLGERHSGGGFGVSEMTPTTSESGVESKVNIPISSNWSSDVKNPTEKGELTLFSSSRSSPDTTETLSNRSSCKKWQYISNGLPKLTLDFSIESDELSTSRTPLGMPSCTKEDYNSRATSTQFASSPASTEPTVVSAVTEVTPIPLTPRTRFRRTLDRSFSTNRKSSLENENIEPTLTGFQMDHKRHVSAECLSDTDEDDADTLDHGRWKLPIEMRNKKSSFDTVSMRNSLLRGETGTDCFSESHVLVRGDDILPEEYYRQLDFTDGVNSVTSYGCLDAETNPIGRKQSLSKTNAYSNSLSETDLRVQSTSKWLIRGSDGPSQSCLNLSSLNSVWQDWPQSHGDGSVELPGYGTNAHNFLHEGDNAALMVRASRSRLVIPNTRDTDRRYTVHPNRTASSDRLDQQLSTRLRIGELEDRSNAVGQLPSDTLLPVQLGDGFVLARATPILAERPPPVPSPQNTVSVGHVVESPRLRSGNLDPYKHIPSTLQWSRRSVHAEGPTALEQHASTDSLTNTKTFNRSKFHNSEQMDGNRTNKSDPMASQLRYMLLKHRLKLARAKDAYCLRHRVVKQLEVLLDNVSSLDCKTDLPTEWDTDTSSLVTEADVRARENNKEEEVATDTLTSARGLERLPGGVCQAHLPEPLNQNGELNNPRVVEHDTCELNDMKAVIKPKRQTHSGQVTPNCVESTNRSDDQTNGFVNNAPQHETHQRLTVLRDRAEHQLAEMLSVLRKKDKSSRTEGKHRGQRGDHVDSLLLPPPPFNPTALVDHLIDGNAASTGMRNRADGKDVPTARLSPQARASQGGITWFQPFSSTPAYRTFASPRHRTKPVEQQSSNTIWTEPAPQDGRHSVCAGDNALIDGVKAFGSPLPADYLHPKSPTNRFKQTPVIRKPANIHIIKRNLMQPVDGEAESTAHLREAFTSLDYTTSRMKNMSLHSASPCESDTSESSLSGLVATPRGVKFCIPPNLDRPPAQTYRLSDQENFVDPKLQETRDLPTLFHSSMQNWISRSRERQKHVHLVSTERRYSRAMSTEREHLFGRSSYKYSPVRSDGSKVIRVVSDSVGRCAGVIPNPINLTPRMTSTGALHSRPHCCSTNVTRQAIKCRPVHRRPLTANWIMNTDEARNSPKMPPPSWDRKRSNPQSARTSSRVRPVLPRDEQRLALEEKMSALRTNRLRMKIYSEKVLRSVLRRRAAWITPRRDL